MTETADFHVLLKPAAHGLIDEFPTLDPLQVVQAIARATLEVRIGYQICHLDPPSGMAHVNDVIRLARQELEHVTDTGTREGQPLGR
jgi:hypothetical protein